MTTTQKAGSVKFRVLDAMDAPHGGRILRLRLQSGETPRVKSLKGARFRAVSPDGEARREVTVDGFALFGGKPSDDRLARTGRVDVHVTEEGEDDSRPVSLKWELEGPLGD